MSGEGFLSRWSRRKRGLEPEAPPPEPPAPLPVSEAAPAGPEFDLASLPPVESLGPESDFAAFLRPQVPAVLRQAALRRMWSLDPSIRDFVGPADYAWDYNAPGGVPGFAAELGEEVGRLLAQAIGAPPPPDPAAAEPQETPAAEVAPPPEAGPPPVAEAEPPPLSPVRLSPPEPPPPPAAPLAGAAPAALSVAPPPEAPHRRHGGAMPS